MRSSKLFNWSILSSSAAYLHSSLQIRQQNWTIGQTVQTSSGPVIGHTASNAIGVSGYLGISYAQPPLGNLRYSAPLPYNGTAAINASAFVGVQSLASLNSPDC